MNLQIYNITCEDIILDIKFMELIILSGDMTLSNKVKGQIISKLKYLGDVLNLR